MIMLHFEGDVPIADLSLTKPQKARLTRVKAIYMAFLQNPHINALEMSRSMLKAESAQLGNRLDAGDLLTAAKKDVAWFEFVQEHWLTLPSRKVLRYKGLRDAERVIQIGYDTGNTRAVVDGLKQQYLYGELDKPEEDPNRVADAAFVELIPTTDITKVDPNRKRISADRRLQLAKKWGAHIDEHGIVTDMDGTKIPAAGQEPGQEPEAQEAQTWDE